jgi:hypothetical protein
MQHGYVARVAVVMATLLWGLGLLPSGVHAQSIVPPRDMLALTSAGDYTFQVTPSPNFMTTTLSVAATATNPTSFQVHLMTGMVFQAGSNVRVELTFGNRSITVSAFGYLATP